MQQINFRFDIKQVKREAMSYSRRLLQKRHSWAAVGVGENSTRASSRVRFPFAARIG
jgi:hypothetical protein